MRPACNHTCHRPQSGPEQLADNVVHHWGCQQSQLQGAGAQVRTEYGFKYCMEDSEL